MAQLLANVTKLIKDTNNNRLVRLNISHAGGQALMKNNFYFLYQQETQPKVQYCELLS